MRCGGKVVGCKLTNKMLFYGGLKDGKQDIVYKWIKKQCGGQNNGKILYARRGQMAKNNDICFGAVGNRCLSKEVNGEIIVQYA